ncbi:ATPase, AAA family protein [Besnoitia besnoiti]|uniref:ATPase, AAA family protein n=1 Tax=Besnoitia besnoiti TaxID=94643 RepID=A0A2A9MH86_BESBE|nr:ATPase, AAA family protein [Besnoitia besnoiti]PFH37269.1 ATPase, AAA family protein [Besnoitia besnoiti]
MQCRIDASLSVWASAPPSTACAVCASSATLAQFGAFSSSFRLLRRARGASSDAEGRARRAAAQSSHSAASASPPSFLSRAAACAVPSSAPGACVVQLFCAEEDLPNPVKLPLNKFLATADVLFSLGLLAPSAASFPADSRASLDFQPLPLAIPAAPEVTVSLAHAPGDEGASDGSARAASTARSRAALQGPPAAWWEELIRAAAESRASSAKSQALSPGASQAASLSAGPADSDKGGGKKGRHKKKSCAETPASSSSSPSPSPSSSSPSSSSSSSSGSSGSSSSVAASLQASRGLLRFLSVALHGVAGVSAQFRSLTLQGHPVTLQLFASPGSVTVDAAAAQAECEANSSARFSSCFRVTRSTQIRFSLQPVQAGESAERVEGEDDPAKGARASPAAGDSLATAEKPRGGLARVGGLHRVLSELLWCLVLPLLRPDLYGAYGVSPPKGVLLQGPPGSGKTFLARAIAEEIQLIADEVNHGEGARAAARASAAPDASSPVSAVLRSLVRLPGAAALQSRPRALPSADADDPTVLVASAASAAASPSASPWVVPPHLELVNATDLISPVMGQTERNIHALFERCRREQRRRIEEAQAEAAACAERARRERGREATAASRETPVSKLNACEGGLAPAAGDAPARQLVGGGTLLFIDEIDAICPRREDATEVGRRAVCALLACLDGVAADGSLFVLAATNYPYLLDDAIRRAGRLERDLEVGVPTAEERHEVLLKLLQTVPHNLQTGDIEELSGLCQAFVPADLRLLVTSAATQALRWMLAVDAATSSEGAEKNDAVLTMQAGPEARQPVTMKHFRRALRDVRPSALKSVAIEVPHVRWDEIGGYATVKQTLQECVEWPLKFADLFKQLKVAPPRGVLLYGPPGCSKTMMAKAVATESKMNFISVKGPELFSKWVGESERAVREVFRKARQNAPCVVFFDEVDAMGGDREAGEAGGVDSRVLSQMLNEMDGIGPVREVVVIAATNRPDLLDAALLRPGRLDRLVYVPLPDWEARREIALKMLKTMPVKSPLAACADCLASATEGYSGAELVMVCREASMVAVREAVARWSNKQLQPASASDSSRNARERVVGATCAKRGEANGSGEGDVFVDERHLMLALSRVQPRTPKSLLEFYEAYHADSCRRGGGGR